MGVAYGCGRSQRAQVNAGRIFKPGTTWDSNPTTVLLVYPPSGTFGKHCGRRPLVAGGGFICCASVHSCFQIIYFTLESFVKHLVSIFKIKKMQRAF